MDAMPERAKEAANSYIIPSSVNLNLPVEELKLDSATKNDGLSNLYPMRNYQQRASFISESDSVSDEEDFMRRRRQSIMTYNSENRAPDSASRGSYMEKRLEESKFLQQEAEDAQKLERNQGIDNTQRGEESLVIEQEAPKLAVEEEKESRALYPTIPEGKVSIDIQNFCKFVGLQAAAADHILLVLTLIQFHSLRNKKDSTSIKICGELDYGFQTSERFI